MQKKFRALVLAALCCGASMAHANTFYIDAVTGNDANSWDLTHTCMLNASEAQPTQVRSWGPHLVSFRAELDRCSSDRTAAARPNNPIVLGSFEDGAKPIIKGEGADATLILRDVSGWTIQDIAVTNHGEKDDKRIGILIQTSNYSFAIHVLRVDVSDVNGVLSKKAGGIGIIAMGKDDQPAHFDDILVDQSTVSHIAGDGIWLQVADNELRTYRNTHIRLIGNTITDIGKNADHLRGTLDGLIDHNVVRFAGAHEHGNAVASAGPSTL